MTSTKQRILDITLGNTLVNGLINDWRVLEEPSMSVHRIIRFDTNGNFVIKRIPTNPRSSAHGQQHGSSTRGIVISELETMVYDLDKVIIGAYETNYPVKTVKSSRCPPVEQEPNQNKNNNKVQKFTDGVEQHHQGSKMGHFQEILWVDHTHYIYWNWRGQNTSASKNSFPMVQPHGGRR